MAFPASAFRGARFPRIADFNESARVWRLVWYRAPTTELGGTRARLCNRSPRSPRPASTLVANHGEMTAKAEARPKRARRGGGTYPARYPNPRAECVDSPATKQRSGREGCSVGSHSRCSVESTSHAGTPQPTGMWQGGSQARSGARHHASPHTGTRHTGRRRHSESSPSTEMRTGASLAPRRHYGGMCTCDTSTTVPPQLWIDVI